MKLLLAVGPERMKFTKIDNELYESFRKEFPDFDITACNEDEMKVLLLLNLYINIWRNF